MATTFAEFFELRDPKRASFELNPEQDAELYVDLDGVQAQLEDGLERPNPKLLVQGDFGTGKTHALCLVAKKLARPKGFHPVRVELSGFGKRSTFYDVHVIVMSALDGELVELLRGGSVALKKLEASRQLDTDVAHAFHLLADPSLPQDKRANVRAWILGTGPTPTQARNQGFTGRLFERAKPAQLVDIWKAIGALRRFARGDQLMLLIDEGESFGRVVDPDAQANIGAGLRGLFDPTNEDVALVFGLNTPQLRQGGVHPFLRSDVASRIATSRVTLRALDGADRIAKFIRSVCQKLSSRDVLLDARAIAFLSNRLADIHATLALEPRPKALTQRAALQVLTAIGERAYSDEARPPISERHLQAWFPVP